MLELEKWSRMFNINTDKTKSVFVIGTRLRAKIDSSDQMEIGPRLTKAFDLVSRSGLFQILQKVGCKDMQSTVCFDGVTFPVSSGVKQGCVLAPTLFGIFFSMLLHYASADCSEGVYIRTRQMASFSTLPGSAPKPRLLKCSYASCCSRMMLLWHLTPSRTSTLD